MLLTILTEFNTGLAGESPVVKFNRGAPTVTEAEKNGNDEETAMEIASSVPETMAQARAAEAEAKEVMTEQPRMAHVFSWQHLNYTVRVAGDDKKLLDDVFGYVAPGKLTALMGASGAGKVRGDLKLVAPQISFNVDNLVECPCSAHQQRGCWWRYVH